jgi:hypothetical protein
MKQLVGLTPMQQLEEIIPNSPDMISITWIKRKIEILIKEEKQNSLGLIYFIRLNGKMGKTNEELLEQYYEFLKLKDAI